MQTRLIKNAQRKQTVFLHRGIYRWTNFLTLDIHPRISVPSLKFFYLFSVTFLLFLFSFVFFFFHKKNSFFQTHYSIILAQILILPFYQYLYFFFQILPKISKIPHNLSYISFYFEDFFFFYTLSFFSDLDIPS